MKTLRIALVRRLLRYQTVWGSSVFRNRQKFDKQTRQENCKAANRNIEKSPHYFEDQPLRIEIVQKFTYAVGVDNRYSQRNTVWLEFLHLTRFTIRSRLRGNFFPDSASHNFDIHLQFVVVTL